jgi:hypothetical protein
MERSKRRMPCRVHADGRIHNGIVLDLSGSGLFIQTSAKLSPGVRVDLDLSLEEKDTARMHVEVVRRKQVPAQLLTVAQGGVGVRIISAPEQFYRFLQELQEKEREMRGDGGSGDTVPVVPSRPAAAKPQPASAARPAPAAKPAPPAQPPKATFRVRVSQTSGARSRILTVGADNAEQAGKLALKELGDGWKILQVEAA